MKILCTSSYKDSILLYDYWQFLYYGLMGYGGRSKKFSGIISDVLQPPNVEPAFVGGE